MNYLVIIRRKAELDASEVEAITRLANFAAVSNSVDETEPFKKINYLYEKFSGLIKGGDATIETEPNDPKVFHVERGGEIFVTVKEIEV